MKPFLTTHRILLISCFAIISFYANAQYPKQPVLDKGEINDQVQSLISNSSQYEYNGIYYKGINVGYLNLLKKNISDTLSNLYKKLQLDQKTISQKAAIIDSLNNELSNINELYHEAKKEKNSLLFLGVSMSKTAYNSLVWTIILGLLFLLVIIVLLYRRNNIVTVQTRKDLDDLKKEFEAHRKRALEREEKLARQHLDELNKYKK
jgi:hypothetical protein